MMEDSQFLNLFEIHFNGYKNKIASNTINRCNLEIEAIIKKIHKDIGINVDYNLYLEPYEDGCFKVVWKTLKKGLKTSEVFLKEYPKLAKLITAVLVANGLNIKIGDININIGNTTINNYTITEDVQKHKNSFFKTLSNDVDVKNNKDGGVEFKTENQSQKVPKEDFDKKIKEIKETKIPSEFKLHELVIVAPVIDENKIVWKTKDKFSGEMISFYMKDEKFNENFLLGRFPLKQGYVKE